MEKEQTDNKAASQRQPEPPEASARQPNPELVGAFAQAAEAFPLGRAFQDGADPALVAEWQNTVDRLRHEGRWQYIGTPQKIEGYALSEFDTNGHDLLARSRRLVTAICARFVGRLRCGELVSWARAGSPLAPWREVPRGAWSALRLGDVDSGTVKGPGGVALYDVHVGRRAIAPEPPITPGKQGRPSSADLILEEFRRRVAAGEPGYVLRVEAAILARWLKLTHPKEPPAKAKSIEQMIRGEFNAWKASRAKAAPRAKRVVKPSPEPNGPRR